MHLNHVQLQKKATHLEKESQISGNACGWYLRVMFIKDRSVQPLKILGRFSDKTYGSA